MVVNDGPAERTVKLLADVRPYQEATLYGKVSGYLKTVNVDKGDTVKEGQLLAVIEFQETDAQYASASADLANKQRQAHRMDQLVRENDISHQQADQADADAHMAAATLHQLATLRSYERLVLRLRAKSLPVTPIPARWCRMRKNSQTSALAVVTVSDDSRLRVDAYAQQQDAPFVHVGDTAEIIRRRQSFPQDRSQG